MHWFSVTDVCAPNKIPILDCSDDLHFQTDVNNYHGVNDFLTFTMQSTFLKFTKNKDISLWYLKF